MTRVTSTIFCITGGASGIGAATCRLLAERGATVLAICDISSKRFDDVKLSIEKVNPSTEVQFTVVDVTSSAQVTQWIQGVVSQFGDLHGAANIAGIAQGAGLRSTPTITGETDDEWHKILDTNLNGVFYCTREQVRAMKGLPSGDRSIVNVGSIAGCYHMPDVYAYGTSKGACAYFTHCVAADAISEGIRVNNVSPGELFLFLYPPPPRKVPCQSADTKYMSQVLQTLPCSRNLLQVRRHLRRLNNRTKLKGLS